MGAGERTNLIQNSQLASAKDKGDETGPPYKFRILMVSDFFHPNTGGVETHIYQLSQCLLARGHAVVVLTHAYGPSHQGVRYLTNGLKVYYLSRLPIYQQATLPTIFGAFAPLRRILIAERINLVHGHQAFSTMAHEAILHARTMGYPVVFTDHSLFGFADPASILVNKVLKFTLADVHATVCVSHISKENTVLRACVPPQRVYVIPNAVEASLFHPIIRLEQLPQDSITVVAMSRLVYRKGIDLLAAVLPELCNLHPKLRFVIGGDGPKRSTLEEVILSQGLSDRVRLVGAVPHNQVRDLLSQGQIFLNCSLTEAFCMSLVEAASVGLLVVSTCVGGVPEVLPDSMMLLADPSPEGIIATMEEAVQRVQCRQRHGFDPNTQHDAVAQMYSWPEVARRTESVYEDARSGFRCESLASRMQRYSKCGKWFGKICCCVAAVDWLYWQWLEWWEPRKKIAPAAELYKLCN